MYFKQELVEGLMISLRALRANIMRSVLTMAGIIIGVLSVTLMSMAIEGINRAFDKSAAAFGMDVLYIQKFPWMSHDDWSTFRNRRNLEVKYASRIERQSMFVDAVAPVASTQHRLTYGDNSMETAFISGTTNQYLMASGNTLSDGRFLSAEESAGGRPVCVVGANVVENLFPHEDPLEKTIRVAGYPYTIIGVFEKQGGLFGDYTSDNRVIIPMDSFQAHFGGRRDVTIQVRVADKGNMEDAKLELEGIMRQLRNLAPGKSNDFNINQQELLTETFAPLSAMIAIVGLCITGLSLFVGGIGIMNIMFVSVTERTKEIGIRKAIGAKRRTILMQFLSEAATLCLMGGLVGLLLALPLSMIVDKVLPTAMPISVVVIAILVSLAVGVVSGFLPAFRAARMDPVEALRYE